MKKIVLAVVAVLSMTQAFAVENTTTENGYENAYEMKISTSSLSNTLKLDGEQTEAVEYVNRRFERDLRKAGKASEEHRSAMLSKAIKKDLSYMHTILNREQYQKYLMLLNATLNNRGLNK